MFDGDEHRTILYLQHALGPSLRRPYELSFQFLSERDTPLDKIEKVCDKMPALYGMGWDMEMVRPEPALFEMKSSAVSGATSSPATTPSWSRPSYARGTRTG
jgi:hypothetical protein